MYCIKACPVDPNRCKGRTWNQKSWGHTKDEAISRYKEHLYNKHHIDGPIAEKIRGEVKWDVEAESPPSPNLLTIQGEGQAGMSLADVIGNSHLDCEASAAWHKERAAQRR